MAVDNNHSAEDRPSLGNMQKIWVNCLSRISIGGFNIAGWSPSYPPHSTVPLLQAFQHFLLRDRKVQHRHCGLGVVQVFVPLGPLCVLLCKFQRAVGFLLVSSRSNFPKVFTPPTAFHKVFLDSTQPHRTLILFSPAPAIRSFAEISECLRMRNIN